jgi:hypothetical protein
VSRIVDWELLGVDGSAPSSTPDQIATAVADGIEARAARIIRPKLWGPVSALRGVFNNVSDELLRHDKATLAHI